MNSGRKIHYNIIFRTEPEGGFTVIVPSLPGCVTYGRDLKEAQKNAGEAIGDYLKSLQKHNEPIPSDGTSFLTSIDLEIPTRKKTYA